jgi:hypothetical protein
LKLELGFAKENISNTMLYLLEANGFENSISNEQASCEDYD